MTLVVHIALLVMVLFAGATRTVDEKELKQIVAEFVASRFEGQREEFTIEYRSLPNKLLNIPEKAALRILADASTNMRNGVMLPVEVIENEHVVHTFLVSLKIRTFGTVLFAANTIEKRERGDAIAMREERVETTMLPPDAMRTTDSLRGKRTKRIIRRGAALTESMFERIPTVNQGSSVTMIVKEGSVIIKARAIVREDGVSGDIVLVQKAGTGEKFKARILDEHTVELFAQK